MKKIIIIMLMLLAAESFAADSSSKYAVLGEGLNSCETVIAKYKEGNEPYQLIVAWVLGYFTAANSLVYDGQDITHDTNSEEVMLWIRDYCEENSLKYLVVATEALYWELKDK